MKKYKVIPALIAVSAMLATGCSQASAGGAAPVEIKSVQTTQSAVQTPAVQKTPEKIDTSGASVIKLNGDSAQAANGAQYQNGTVKITRGGKYVLEGTLNDGSILVDAGDADVTLVLNNADITCKDGSAIYVYKSSNTTLHINEGTNNTLTDGQTYAFNSEYSSQAEDEPNACIYSKSDLTIQGDGALTVNGNYNNGITGKDDLVIFDSDITVNAKNNGITGKDSNSIDSANITVISGGDAIRTNNDTDTEKGNIEVKNTTLNLTAAEDGIQADTTLTIEGCVFNVKTGGGSGTTPSETLSTKGIKAGGALSVSQGSYTFDCSDDAVHSNGDVNILSGGFTISTGDDAFHSDTALKIDGGEIEVLKSYEGLEGKTIDINGGDISIVSSDDGLNAAGGMDSSGFRGMTPGGFGAANADNYIKITGGNVAVNAGGDGLDSNGSIDVSGGVISVSSTGRGDGALDCDGNFALTGGTLFAADVGGMFQAPNGATQYTICAGFEQSLPKGTFINISDGSQSFVLELQSDAANIIFSSPELKKGTTYEISYGGTYSGSSDAGICSGGSYSGGTVLTQITLNDYVTSYGVNANVHGGMGGGRPGMMPGDAMPGTPPQDGSFPDDFQRKGRRGVMQQTDTQNTTAQSTTQA